jgi:hypothetical protein
MRLDVTNYKWRNTWAFCVGFSDGYAGVDHRLVTEQISTWLRGIDAHEALHYYWAGRCDGTKERKLKFW